MRNLQNSLLWKRSILFLFFFAFAISFALAQDKTVTGTVTSEAEGPIPGVSIVIEGTFDGTATNFDGNYNLVVPGSDAVLVFSAIGFTSQTVVVGDRTTVDVVLAPFLVALDEVVVIGYGTQQKKE
ncbi:MAG: hypothetical protein HN955_01035, partial [Prolixibacteraceae bacterium]|nr:hypothetical protein [Prolixibacteraceae bacterium]